MAQGDPQGWASLGTNDPTRYEAKIKLTKVTEGTYKDERGKNRLRLINTKRNVVVITNRVNGNYDVYEDRGILGRELIYSYGSRRDETLIKNRYLYNQYFTDTVNFQKRNLDTGVKKSTLQLAENNATTSTQIRELNDLKNTKGYKSVSNTQTQRPAGGAPGGQGSQGQTSSQGLSPNTDANGNITFSLSTFEGISGVSGESTPGASATGGGLRYPLKRKSNQDHILFTSMDRKGNEIEKCTLPIQSTIQDTNTVDWNQEGINPLQLYGAEASGSLIKGQSIEPLLKKMELLATDDETTKQLQEAVAAIAAGKAVGVDNLLSRLSGAVVNPNLQLLFRGPQLRPFNFTFTLSPRSAPEASMVKRIIRFFKFNMAVKRTNNKLFLTEPNQFKIQYINGNGGDHQSINKVKNCALQSCSVNYTPAGTYSTFNDSEYTMTQYQMTLQFMELQPVYSEDYSGGIGF